jgi:hypothetical protein
MNDRASAANMFRSIQKAYGHKAARQIHQFYVRKTHEGNVMTPRAFKHVD